MINLTFTYGLAIPLAFVFLNVLLFGAARIFRAPITGTFREITEDWLKFMKQGIPIPTDYESVKGRFTGEPVLVRPLFHTEETKTVAK